MQKLADQLNRRFNERSTEEILRFFLHEYKTTIAFSTSLGAEDQVLTDLIVREAPETSIFTLDTGRVYPETYDLLVKTNARYGINIDVYMPNGEETEQMVNEHGMNLFYKSIEQRKKCCEVRKLRPLRRALSGLKVWICGLRQEQSVTRNNLQVVEWDHLHELLKINPLLYWTEKEVWDYINKEKVPYNPLHDRGYPSIGCQPCTRAIRPEEDVRAGRWWWENPETKECGLHSK